MMSNIKSDGTDCYKHVLLYTDDDLFISENFESILIKEIGKCFDIKEDTVRPPKLHLGGSMSKLELENSVAAWAFSLSQHAKSSVHDVEHRLHKLKN